MSLPLDTIVCGESKSVLSTFPDNSVDIVFTSPPYNFDMDYGEYGDEMPYDKYLETINGIFSECHRVLKEGGRMIINIAPSFPRVQPNHHMITNHLTSEGMIWMGEIIWMKNNFSGGTAWGSWKSPSAPTLCRPYEFICLFGKGSVKHKGKKEDIDITKDEFLIYRNAHWTIQAETRMRKKYGHPAMFPEQLVYQALKLFSYQNDVVVDPFNGAGTTTAVCQRMNRRFIGIDMDENYCNTARERLNDVEGILPFEKIEEEKPDESDLTALFDAV